MPADGLRDEPSLEILTLKSSFDVQIGIKADAAR